MSSPTSTHSGQPKGSIDNIDGFSCVLLRSSSNSSYSTTYKQQSTNPRMTTSQTDDLNPEAAVPWADTLSINLGHGPSVTDPYEVHQPFIAPASSRPRLHEPSHCYGSASIRPWFKYPTSEDSLQAITRSGAPRRYVSVPRPKTRPTYNLVTQYHGLKLFRLCASVPYLLGPWTVVERLQTILEHGLADIQFSNQTDCDKNVIDIHHDQLGRALFYILNSLSMSSERRIATGNWATQGLAASGSTLRLYADRRPLPPQILDVSLQYFVQMVEEWKKIPNPALNCSDHPAAKNAWSDITAKLRARNIRIEKLDPSLYRELTMECGAEQLDEKIDLLEEWQNNGGLEARYAEYERKSVRQAAAVSEANESISDFSGLFSKRFTHKHPCGITAAALELELIVQHEQTSFSSRFLAQTEDTPSRTLSTRFLWLQTLRRQRYAFTQTMIILILLLSILVPLVWYSRSQKSDWTHSTG